MKLVRKFAGWVLLAALTAGCGSTRFEKNTYGTLASFAAAYQVEEPARALFCKDKLPQPAACVKAYEAAAIGWAAFVEGTDLFAVYLETRSDTVQGRIVSLLPELISSTIELTTVVRELR